MQTETRVLTIHSIAGSNQNENLSIYGIYIWSSSPTFWRATWRTGQLHVAAFGCSVTTKGGKASTTLRDDGETVCLCLDLENGDETSAGYRYDSNISIIIYYSRVRASCLLSTTHNP